jgi:hypothetical protein
VARTLSGALPDLLENLEGWNPDFENYNIPPTAQVPVVVEQPDATTGAVQRIVDWAQQRRQGADMRSFTLAQINEYQKLTQI